MSDLIDELRAQANQHPLDVDLAQFDIAATAIEQLQKQIVELELQVRSISLSRNAEIAKEAFKVVMEALEYDDGRYIETESDRLDMIEEYVAKLQEHGK